MGSILRWLLSWGKASPCPPRRLVRSARPRLELLEAREVPAVIGSQIIPLLPPIIPDAGAQLTPSDVGQLLERAAAATPQDNAIVAVVDRDGNILGVRVEGNVSSAITSDPEKLIFAIDGAVAEARTPALFSNDTAPLTSRTIQNLSESTITQQEVNSDPTLLAMAGTANSLAAGPGFVAPTEVGGHFPANVEFTPMVDLNNIEASNRDTTDKLLPNGTIATVPTRFNVNPAFIPSYITADGIGLNPMNSYGFVAGPAPGVPLEANAQPRGIGTLPGGIPLFKDNALVGGIGVFFPGTTGYASEENSSLSTNYHPNLPDLSQEAEYIAYAAAGGVPGDPATSVGTIAGVPPLPDIVLPNGRIDLVGVTLNIYGPEGTEGPAKLVRYGQSLGTGDPNSGTNHVVDQMGDTLLQGKPVPQGWLVLPHNGTTISAGQVLQAIDQGIAQAVITRAAIRLPLNSPTGMVFAVTDPNTGEVLGLYRMPDATIFSLDIAVAKARNVGYYNNPAQLQPQDRVPGIPDGAAFTARTFRYLVDPRYPEGIDGNPPGPFSILNDGGANPLTALTTSYLTPSQHQSVQGYDAYHPGTNFHDPNNPLNQNGVVFFPGSSGLYTGSTLIGGLGVSGDGVDQDDVVTFAASANMAPPSSMEVDNYQFRGVNLPYQKFNRQPLLPTN